MAAFMIGAGIGALMGVLEPLIQACGVVRAPEFKLRCWVEAKLRRLLIEGQAWAPPCDKL